MQGLARFLAPNDFVGSQGNWGCRLTDSQIMQAVSELQSSGWIFGGNTRFVWDGMITTFVNEIDGPPAPPNQGRGNDLSQLLFWIDMAPSATWSSNRINIYFAGNYLSGIQGFWGATFDPAVHSPSAGIYRLIVLNDGGFGEGFGVRELLSRFYNVAEHEMCHYLGRFRNRTFMILGSPRTYNSGEHINPPHTDNLLRDGGLSQGGNSPPYPLVVPGLSAVNGTEKNEVFGRVLAGLWNAP